VQQGSQEAAVQVAEQKASTVNQIETQKVNAAKEMQQHQTEQIKAELLQAQSRQQRAADTEQTIEAGARAKAASAEQVRTACCQPAATDYTTQAKAEADAMVARSSASEAAKAQEERAAAQIAKRSKVRIALSRVALSWSTGRGTGSLIGSGPEQRQCC
jgi:membrane protein involved in colicin uptake